MKLTPLRPHPQVKFAGTIRTLGAVAQQSGVRFGTSGARGLALAMTDEVCGSYALAFVEHLREHFGQSERIAIAGDLRPSTGRILRSLQTSLRTQGVQVEHLGRIPSPALAAYGMKRGIGTIMVTGSHIPEDRNGLKFTTPIGEITKADEESLLSRRILLPDLYGKDSQLRKPDPLLAESSAAAYEYAHRYLKAFPEQCLAGLRLGVYGHSAVGRQFMVDLYTALGAKVTALDWSERFVSVDTEAIREEDVRLARKHAARGQFDAIVSTDGDSDRPLLADETGHWLRGDVLGVLTAEYLGADAVATPVTCNSILERVGKVPQIRRTRIGSPYVLEAIDALRLQGAILPVGYEANGGFLLGAPAQIPDGGVLEALPTRDAVIVHLAALLMARREGIPVSGLSARLPARFTASVRDQNFSTTLSSKTLRALRELPPLSLERTLNEGAIVGESHIDGHRIEFSTGALLHFRASGNAPELRIYSESDSPEEALRLAERGKASIRRFAGDQV